jgi:uncharacterized membrane protein
MTSVSARKTWPAILALYLSSPIIAELLTGSTPPLAWNNVGGIMITLGLYGSGAILAREIVRRRQLRWENLLILGAAYGVLEEGIAFQSWFNPTWTNIVDAARLWNVNWTLVVIFTIIHMVLSITTPVVIVEAIFPRLAHFPWLGRKGFIAFSIWLIGIVTMTVIIYGFVIFAHQGYAHPSTSYWIAPITFLALLLLGILACFSFPQKTLTVSAPPALWWLRCAGFLGTFGVLMNLYILRMVLSPIFPILLALGMVILSFALIQRWAKRPGWGMEHRLALVSGVMGFFIVFSPVFEFVIPSKNMTGLTLVNGLALGGLVWLARRSAARMKTRIPSA